jgi:multiple sugar transport system ATP-binding protein
MAMARIRLAGVTKQYGSVTALRDFSLDIPNGDCTVLLGPSGSGKSTVLRLIAGLEEPTSGDIYIDGVSMRGVHTRDRNLSMVFESPDYALYPNMTAYENMAFGLRMRRDPTEERHATNAEREGAIRRRVENVAGRLSLSTLLNRRRGELSAGQTQSVALGRAVTRQPQLFLMDDPLSSLDAAAHMPARAEMKRLQHEIGATILYVTHDQADALAMGDHIAVINEGVLQQVGTPRQLYEHPANTFVATFIPSPSMNLLPVEVQVEGEDVFLVGSGFRLRAPDHLWYVLSGRSGQRITLGLRPECIRDPRYMPGPAPDPSAIVQTRVLVREYTGADLYLHLDLDGQELVARLDTRTFAWRGDNLAVFLDPEQMYVFDPLTGKALT